MADTYNPNEIVKCKHLTEFALQLNHKLDGNTSLRQRAPSIRVAGISLGSTFTTRVGFSQLTWNSSSSFFDIRLNLHCGLTNSQQPSVLPKIVNLTSTNPEVSYKFHSISWYNNNMGLWYLSSGPTGANASDKKAVTFTFQIQIPAGDDFDAYLSPVITVEIYDDSI